MSKHILLYILLSLIAASVYFPGITDSFLSDDWSIIARNMDLSPQEMLQRLQSVNAGWYRPTFDLFITVCWRIFDLNPRNYHLVTTFLYILVIALVGNLAEILTGERGIGILATILFGIHSVHAEPVLWIAASNEILAGMFVVLSSSSYIMFRKSTRPIIWLLLAGGFYLLAITSKETAVFLPAVFVAYDVWIHRPSLPQFNWRTFAPAVPFLVLGFGFTIFRFSTGSPYPISLSPIRLAINPVYYLAVEVFSLPDNYGYLTALPLWKQSPLLPILATSMTAWALGMLGWLCWKLTKSTVFSGYANVFKFTVSWSVIALSPVILTATGRTAFMSSISVVYSIAILIFLAWQGIKTNQKHYRLLFTGALTLFIGANLIVSSYRTYWWYQASQEMKSVLSQLEYALHAIPDTSEIYVVGLPDHLRHAYTFRNAFPYINQLLYPQWHIQVVLDTDITEDELAEQEICGASATFWYDGQALVRVR